MQPLSGVKHPELDKFLPGGIWAIFVVLFLKPCGVLLSSIRVMRSIPAVSRVASRWYTTPPTRLPACPPDKTGAWQTAKLRERAGHETKQARDRLPGLKREIGPAWMNEYDPDPCLFGKVGAATGQAKLKIRASCYCARLAARVHLRFARACG